MRGPLVTRESRGVVVPVECEDDGAGAVVLDGLFGLRIGGAAGVGGPVGWGGGGGGGVEEEGTVEVERWDEGCEGGVVGDEVEG